MNWILAIGVVLSGISMWLKWQDRKRLMEEREQIYEMYFKENYDD